MNARKTALLTLVLAGAFAWNVDIIAQDKSAGDGHAKAFMECAKACDDCARICDACGNHCAKLLSEGRKGHLKTLRTCQDCATLCSAAAQITARMGPFSHSVCTSCAEACKRCGDACDQFKDDPLMRQCAEECRRCEQACRNMLKHAVEGT